MTNKSATININNDVIDLPIYTPTLGMDVIDIKGIAKDAFTFDPGFYATASCASKITYIDGDHGVLLYRGYPIEQLAEKKDYIDVCYLLMHGELPSHTEKSTFSQTINSTTIPKNLDTFFNAFSKDAHPMGIMLSVIGALSTEYHYDLNKKEDCEKAVTDLVALTPIIAANAYRHGQGLPFIASDPTLSYAQNFLHMLFGNEKANNPALIQAFDRIFTLHADHEQNASTSTVRMAGSTGTHPFAAMAAGISALWGAAHGGANEACLTMLNEIGDESHIEKYLAKAKDKSDPFRLMGFGHRVYKSYDPRAKIMQHTCHDVLQAMNAKESKIFKLAMALEKIALEDDYFVSKKLYPNVDFYSGITLSAMGIPTNLFTVIFVLGRMIGWASHWLEMVSDPDSKLSRPRQLYIGKPQRDIA